MRVVFMGTPDFAVPALEALAARHEVAAVYCQPPRPAGRGQNPRPSVVQARAEALGLPVRCPASLRDPAEQAAFAALGAEVAVVAAYGLILPRAVLDAPARGCLNIHASLLPRWRGAAPIHRAVLAGDAETGVCIMRMEPGLDTGPVLLSEATPIGPADTTGDLHDRLAALGARLILAALDGLDRLVPQPQPEAGVTYAAKIDKAEARIDWSHPAAKVDRLARALSPFPGAWAIAADTRLRLLRTRLLPAPAGVGELPIRSGEGRDAASPPATDTGTSTLPAPVSTAAPRSHGPAPEAAADPGSRTPPRSAAPAPADVVRVRVAGAEAAATPGTVLPAPPGKLVVACGSGAIEVLEAQREGRRPMPAAELLKGLPLPPGTVLG